MLVSYMPLASPLLILVESISSAQAPIDTNQRSRVTRDTPTDSHKCARRAIFAPRRALKEIQFKPLFDDTRETHERIRRKGQKPSSNPQPEANKPRDLRGPPHDRRPLHRPHTRRDARLPVVATMITTKPLKATCVDGDRHRRHGDACLARDRRGRALSVSRSRRGGPRKLVGVQLHETGRRGRAHAIAVVRRS